MLTLLERLQAQTIMYLIAEDENTAARIFDPEPENDPKNDQKNDSEKEIEKGKNVDVFTEKYYGVFPKDFNISIWLSEPNDEISNEAIVALQQNISKMMKMVETFKSKKEDDIWTNWSSNEKGWQFLFKLVSRGMTETNIALWALNFNLPKEMSGNIERAITDFYQNKYKIEPNFLRDELVKRSKEESDAVFRKLKIAPGLKLIVLRHLFGTNKQAIKSGFKIDLHNKFINMEILFAQVEKRLAGRKSEIKDENVAENQQVNVIREEEKAQVNQPAKIVPAEIPLELQVAGLISEINQLADFIVKNKDQLYPAAKWWWSAHPDENVAKFLGQLCDKKNDPQESNIFIALLTRASNANGLLVTFPHLIKNLDAVKNIDDQETLAAKKAAAAAQLGPFGRK